MSVSRLPNGKWTIDNHGGEYPTEGTAKEILKGMVLNKSLETVETVETLETLETLETVETIEVVEPKKKRGRKKKQIDISKII